MLRNQSEEHELFRQSVRNFVEKEITPNVLTWESEGAVPREIFEKAGELGYLGLRIGEDVGGSGLDFRYTGIFVQEMMRCGSIGAPVALLAHAEFATKVVDRAGSADLRERIVRPAAAGKMIGSLGVTEPGAGSDVAALRTKAVRDGDDYVINGSKLFITNGTISDFVTTAVRTGGEGYGGISLIVVPTDTPGFSRGRRLRKIGTHASDTGEIFYDDCRVPAANLVGEENGGFRLIMEGFVGERLVLSFLACAHTRLMWEEARRYGHERHAFGRPLLANQVWTHRLADVRTALEAAEALTERALDLHLRGEPCDGEVSMAKLFTCEIAVDAARTCAQIFGGMSHMEECLMGRLYRDSLALTIGAGSSEMMREIIARNEGLAVQGAGQ
ncbi:MAG: acyl-CoA dehydrogenase family protein [Alphaproteobacteria bacterium]|nr:acyl-CoA dehydrogenase family protein [Alphaproteobacteria bacterium]